MSQFYTITIKNGSQSPQTFMLYHDQPTISPTPSNPVFTNIYQASSQLGPYTSPGSPPPQTSFTIPVEYYAVIGTSQTPLAGGVAVQTSSVQPVQLATATSPGSKVHVIPTEENDVNAFPEFGSTSPTQTNYGAFSVKTGAFAFPNNNNVFVGAGVMNVNREVIPIATLSIEGSREYTMEPHNKFYVSTGTGEPATVLDTANLGQASLDS